MIFTRIQDNPSYSFTLAGGKMIPLLFVSLLFFIPSSGIAQVDSNFLHSFRVYLDNDFINLRGDGTDRAYTNGLRLDYFYVKKELPKFFLSKLLPGVGEAAVNTFGWSVMQMMYSPEDIGKQIPDSTDYAYSGGIFAVHSLHSADPERKFSFQSGITLGVLGPASLAEQTQKLVHKIGGFIEPKGWDHQLKSDLLINFDFTTEKMLAEYGRSLELIGGVSAQLGSMFTSLSAYVNIRGGKMNPYFDGFLSQTNASKALRKKIKFNFVCIPKAEVVFYNALVDGGLFRRWANRDLAGSKRPLLTSPEFFVELHYGFVLSWRKLGLSVLQKTFIPTTDDLPDNEVGNISVSIAF